MGDVFSDIAHHAPLNFDRNDIMTALLIFLRFLQLLEFLASPGGIMAGIWLGCYWLMLDLTTLGTGLSSLVASLCAWGYYASELLDF